MFPGSHLGDPWWGNIRWRRCCFLSGDAATYYSWKQVLHSLTRCITSLRITSQWSQMKIWQLADFNREITVCLQGQSIMCLANSTGSSVPVMRPCQWELLPGGKSSGGIDQTRHTLIAQRGHRITGTHTRHIQYKSKVGSGPNGQLSGFFPLSAQVLLSLRLLLMMKPHVLSRVCREVAFGLHELLKTNAANIHCTDDWYTLFSLLECIGAGIKPPAALQVANTNPDNDTGDSVIANHFIC